VWTKNIAQPVHTARIVAKGSHNVLNHTPRVIMPARTEKRIAAKKIARKIARRERAAAPKNEKSAVRRKRNNSSAS
jgi:hypothetical protein